jgi:lipid-binding SYLF domain-containing protein
MVKGKDFFHSHWLATAVSALIGLVLTNGAGWAANPDEQHSEISKRLADSAKTLENVMASPKRSIPEATLHHAVCVAIFPSTIQVAVLVGGKHGKGLATVTTNADILSYSRTRGLFAGTNLNGSAITEDSADARLSMALLCRSPRFWRAGRKLQMPAAYL